MAILSGEQSLVSTLQSAITLFRANLSTFVPDIFGFETMQAQSEIMQWWGNANSSMVIQEGFTNRPVQGLSWNVTIGVEQEIIKRQPIGQGGVSGALQTQMTDFDSSYIVACLGPNKDWLRWSQMLCKWALLYYRQALLQQYGLMQQKLLLGPLQPIPDDLRDAVKFQYMRTVTLTAQHIDSWNLLAVPVITSAGVSVDPNFVEMEV